MNELLQALVQVDNVAVLVCLFALVGCGYAHLLDRRERKERDKLASAERELLYTLIRDNTAAMHGLRQAISLLTNKDL